MVAIEGLPGEDLGDAAVRLLAERARLRPEQMTAQAGTLCALAGRADGMPLVLELLASALHWYTPSELLGRLDEVMLELTAEEPDRPDRHTNVTAAVEWSLRQPASQPGPL